MKKLSLIISVSTLFLLVAYPINPASAQKEIRWRPLSSSPREGFYEDIWFINPSTGWVVNTDGRIFKTTDGGESWQKQLDINVGLRSVGFADSLRGWAGTLTNSKILYMTTNGGVTWNQVQNIPDPAPEGICGIWVVNESVVYGCGRYDRPARIIKSINRGISWTSIDISEYATTLIDCYFFSPDSGFVVGGVGPTPTSFLSDLNAVILFTSDGGNTWETRYRTNRTNEWCWKISFPTSNVGYVSIEGSDFFLKTTDGGITWQEKRLTNNLTRQQGVGFITNTLGWIGGDKTFETTDGGDTWDIATFAIRKSEIPQAIIAIIPNNTPVVKAILKNAPAKIFYKDNKTNPKITVAIPIF